MSSDRTKLRGEPLTDLERMCIGAKARGKRNGEIGALLKIGPRIVAENLLRARHKLGATTLEGAISQYTEAQVLRSIVAGLDRITDLDQIPSWREMLNRMVESSDPRPVLECVHGQHMVRESCEECLYVMPGGHDFEPVKFRHAPTNKAMERCTRCRRTRSSHGRVGEKKRRMEQK